MSERERVTREREEARVGSLELGHELQSDGITRTGREREREREKERRGEGDGWPFAVWVLLIGDLYIYIFNLNFNPKLLESLFCPRSCFKIFK